MKVKLICKEMMGNNKHPLFSISISVYSVDNYGKCLENMMVTETLIRRQHFRLIQVVLSTVP